MQQKMVSSEEGVREKTFFSVITLKQSQEHYADQGAAFEVIFDKTRHFAGDDAAPFQVRLREQMMGFGNEKLKSLGSTPRLSKLCQNVENASKRFSTDLPILNSTEKHENLLPLQHLPAIF